MEGTSLPSRVSKKGRKKHMNEVREVYNGPKPSQRQTHPNDPVNVGLGDFAVSFPHSPGSRLLAGVGRIGPIHEGRR